MGLSSRLFPLSADDALHALASSAFMRMLRREDVARVPDFAGQRVRQASIVVEVVNLMPLRMVHWTFSILDIDADGLLDVERLSAQQFARVDDLLEPARSAQAEGGRIVDAARRFVARGGSWEPDERLRHRIEAAALGRVSCPRVRLVRCGPCWLRGAVRHGWLRRTALHPCDTGSSSPREPRRPSCRSDDGSSVVPCTAREIDAFPRRPACCAPNVLSTAPHDHRRRNRTYRWQVAASRRTLPLHLP